MRNAINFELEGYALRIRSGCGSVSYNELGERVARAAECLRRLARPALAFNFSSNSVEWVVSYLACLTEGIPLGLGDPAPAARDRVIAHYRPSAVLLPKEESSPPVGYSLMPGQCSNAGLSIWLRDEAMTYEIDPHPSLALLLSTSGSTGDAKLVRLSASNLIENARSIIEYLKLGPGEAAALSLPLHYSYGLSILNSHLLAGGSVMLTEHSFMRPEFWREAHEGGCTSFSGVPYMYETLQRLRVDPLGLKHLRTLTQAGGHLRPETVNHFATGARARGGRFFVMYGQTEATARIAYVPPERLAEKVGSIGVAVPRGEIWLAPVDGAPDLRQIIYRGPNVMLGYALSPSDLAKGDEHHGILATGDLAEQDEDGFFRITGRLARFAKLFGKRINLSDVEVQAEIGLKIRAAALDGGDCIRLMLEGADEAACTAVRGQIAGWLGVPPLAVRVSAISQIPLTSSGKKDYKALR